MLLKCDIPTEEERKKPNILFLIADDWSYPHAGIYGDPVINTPTFDQIATEGALFHNAYCASPSCSPSRASILTGRYPHQNESAGNLWSVFPKKFPNWVTVLSENGYHTGKTRKGWGPGDFEAGGYEYNPAGKDYEDFDAFFAEKPLEKPFVFWFGSTDPHRDYEMNSGIQSGLSIDDVVVPGFLPNTLCTKNDMLDYYFEVERFDRECGEIIEKLRAAGELDNTIVVMTSDNGMPFPRAKANLYDYGTRMPLAIRYPERIQKGEVIRDFMNFVDFAPTFLEAAGLQKPENVTGKSLWPLIEKNADPRRQRVFLERERHANVREGDLSYPMRAVRTKNYLYIRNFFPDRWPAGDPTVHQSVGQFGDVDNSISKSQIMIAENRENTPNLFQLTFGKRPAEELYNVVNDPFQLKNLATSDSYAEIKQDLAHQLDLWMKGTNDPRSTNPQTIYWDTVRYTPDYQHENFDLQASIDSYYVLMNGDSIKCE